MLLWTGVSREGQACSGRPRSRLAREAPWGDGTDLEGHSEISSLELSDFLWDLEWAQWDLCEP